MKRDQPPKKSPLMQLLSEKSGDPSSQSDDALQLDSIGCTANVVLVDHNLKKIFVANAGDSRAVMAVGGTAVPLSFDHKPENEIEIDRIHKAGSTVVDGRVDGNLNLTRAIGDLKYKQKDLPQEEHPITSNPDIFEYDLTENVDFIIMGCDGVWEKLSNDEMVATVYKKLGDNPAKADLKNVVTELLNENLSPDFTQTSK